MIKIKVWCLPKPTEAALKRLYEALAQAMKGVPEVDGETLLVLFPADLMAYELGQEIAVEVTGLRASRIKKIDAEVRNRIANRVGRVLKEYFPDAEVDVDVPVGRYDDGHWTSKPAVAPAAASPKKTSYSRKVLNEPVEVLSLAVRARNCLHAINVFSIGDLVQRTEEVLIRAGLLRKDLIAIKTKLETKKLKLAE